MACGPAFLRPEKELTFRLCYINFDGEQALEASQTLGLDQEITLCFLEKYCFELTDAIQAIKQWVLRKLSSNHTDQQMEQQYGLQLQVNG